MSELKYELKENLSLWKSHIWAHTNQKKIHVANENVYINV